MTHKLLAIFTKEFIDFLETAKFEEGEWYTFKMFIKKIPEGYTAIPPCLTKGIEQKTDLTECHRYFNKQE